MTLYYCKKCTNLETTYYLGENGTQKTAKETWQGHATISVANCLISVLL